MDEFQWRGAPDFAEFAEAIGVTTRQIMSVQNPHKQDALVLYTATPDENDTLIHSVLLRRDTDNVLFMATSPKAHPGMWEEILARAEIELPRGD